LVWSKGLKERFAVEEQSDEDLAAGSERGSELFARIDLVSWRAVLRHDQAHGISIRGQLLEMAGVNDRIGFEMILEALRSRLLRRAGVARVPSRGSLVTVGPFPTVMSTP
jgi:hypothetical protein